MGRTRSRPASNTPLRPLRRLQLLIVVALSLLPGGCARLELKPVTSSDLATLATPSGASTPVPSALSEDEGLLILDVESDVAIERILLDRAIASGPLPAGRHVWLVRIPGGSYRWDRIEFGNKLPDVRRFALSELEADLGFEIEPGAIHYAGQLLIRQDAHRRSPSRRPRVALRNHAARAVRLLLEREPGIMAAFPIRHAGASDDPFLDSYSSARASPRPDDGVSGSSRDTPIGSVSTVAPVRDAPVGLSAAALFSQDGIRHVIVSPTGDWLLAHAVQGQIHGLLLKGAGLATTRTVFATENPLVDVTWVGPHRYVARYRSGSGGVRTLLGRIVRDAERVAFEHEWLDSPGGFVAGLPLEPETLLWTLVEEERSTLYRIPLNEDLQRRGGRFHRNGVLAVGKKIAAIQGQAQEWIVDRRGEPRAVLRWDGEDLAVLARPKGSQSFRSIRRFKRYDTASSTVRPVALTADEERLIVLAHGDRDTLSLFELDMRNGQLLDLVFSLEGIDLSGALTDPFTGALVAAVYEQGGERRFHYLDSYETRELKALRGRFPREEVHLVSTDLKRRFLVFLTSSARSPGRYHLLDVETGRVVVIGESASYARESDLVEPELLTVASNDGTRIEAFLTLPGRIPSGGAPLVVRPHGGPIGVRDTRHYDPAIQYLASWGFAVLQVNYRGSGGYGLAFLEAGKREWALGIEDDIDAAVEAVLARAEIDASRICIAGGSYGGFSAVASLQRHPDRYRCGASLNGVTDLPLLLEQGECADSDDCRAALENIIGDPEAEQERLVALSPAYHVRDIESPLLVAHGTRDWRVHPDQSHRLILMLETLGKPHETFEIVGAGHSLVSREWVGYLRTLRRFLTQHLFPGAPFRPDPIPERGPDWIVPIRLVD